MESPTSERLYVVTEYHQDSSGIITANLPEFCPLHSNGNLPCRVELHHCRPRKTGPPFALHVVICYIHCRIFTLYPPGWTPYSRKPLVHLALDFTPTNTDEGVDKFTGTIFDAALDAAKHHFWPKESDADSLTPRFSTQIRHLQRTAILFGIEDPSKALLQQQLIQILQIPGQLLHDSSRNIEICGGCELRGRVISEILQALPNTTTIFQKLASAGHLAGLWPAPFMCDKTIRSRQTPSFQSARTRGSP